MRHRMTRFSRRTPAPAAAALIALGAWAVGAPAARANLTITATFDSSITSDPNSATIQNSINQAINFYQTTFSNPITVNITFAKMSSGLGESNTFVNSVSYSSYVAALRSKEAGQSFLNYVPDANPLNGGTVTTSLADLRALGFSGFNVASDSTISLNTATMNLSRTGAQDPNKYDLQAVAEHEINEVLGLNSALNNLSNGSPAPTTTIGTLDLFRYSANGVRSFSTGATDTAYLSANGGATALVYFNQTQGGDFQDWYSDNTNPAAVRGPAQVQDAFGSPGTQENNGPVELTALQMVGYTLAAAPEPSEWAAWGLGALGLCGLGLRARRRA